MNLRAKVFGTGPIYEGACELLRRHWWRLVDDPPYDLLVLANVTRILPPDELAVARIGTLCFHPSLLPKHRGRDAVYWAIEQGDTQTGVTWFWTDEGIDTGDIAIQQPVAIPPHISAGRLYYGTIVPLGVELLAELLPCLVRGDTPRIPQDELLATYEPPRPKISVDIDARRWVSHA